jgi:hypothetical protein
MISCELTLPENFKVLMAFFSGPLAQRFFAVMARQHH